MKPGVARRVKPFEFRGLGNFPNKRNRHAVATHVLLAKTSSGRKNTFFLNVRLTGGKYFTSGEFPNRKKQSIITSTLTRKQFIRKDKRKRHASY